MKNVILTALLLTTTFASAAHTRVHISNADGLSYTALYTESAWQTVTLDAAALGLSGANGEDVSGQLALSDDAAGLDVTLDAATLDGDAVVLHVSVERQDLSVAMNEEVAFTLANTATGERMTFSVPVLGAAEIDPATLQTVFVE